LKKKLIGLLNRLGLFANVKFYKDKIYKNKIERELVNKRFQFYSNFLNKGEFCFDVGANLGNRSEVFLKIGCKVLAVEPQPELVKYLNRKFRNQIQIIPKAIGAYEGKAELYLSVDSPLSSLSKEWIGELKKGRFYNVDWNKSIEVELTTLDNLITKFGKPDFCKIDVEGYELEVLKGLSQKINLISFEFTIPEFKDRAIECIKHLGSFGEFLCNYSSGESLKFGLDQWLSVEEFLTLFDKLPESGIIDGDIYVKYYE
jgi:FkbM family methyltransferase